MKTKIHFIAYILVSILVAAVSYLSLWNYRASVIEATLSVCGKTMLSDITPKERSNKVKDFLVLIPISEEEKLTLTSAIAIDTPAVRSLAEKMLYFSYTPKKLFALREEIRALSGAVPTVSMGTSENVTEKARTLVQKLYGRRVPFQTASGNGSDFYIRFYCSNICIDACVDGSIRYTADIKGESGRDPLLDALQLSEDDCIMRSHVQNGYLLQTRRNAHFNVDICIDPQTSRVFWAKILFIS